MVGNDNKWIERINWLISSSVSNSDIAYYNRIMRVLDMPDLCEQEWNPVNIIVNKVINSSFYKGFSIVETPEIVSEFETFDLFNFPENHVARRPSDSYFINKSTVKNESILLRPHTSVMWYYYLVNWWWREILEKSWEVKALSYGKVYRVDELDKTHHESFHQIDGLKITEKSKEIINQDTLKDVLSNTIKAIFWENIEYRFNVDQFPYTTDSLEVEVMYNDKWLEVLWAWVVHPTVLEKLWIDSDKYNWWAFGFGIERLAMPLKWIPDIRIFWSKDPRITKQWGNLDSYREVSSYPPVYKDISFLVDKNKFIKDTKEEEKSWELELTRETESDFFAITGAIRDVSWDLIEEVKIIDIYENDEKFWPENKSISIKIVFRSIERTLTNDEINIIYFNIRDKLQDELGYELR